MCCKSRGNLSRQGLLWGVAALAILSVAFVSGSWLFTKEPVLLPHSHIATSITFRIGLWRVCPSVERINRTIQGYPLIKRGCYYAEMDREDVCTFFKKNDETGIYDEYYSCRTCDTDRCNGD